MVLLLLSHESLAEETTTTPNYQPLPLLFFGFVFSNLSQTNPKTYATQLSRDKPKKLMQISKLHKIPQINPKLNANFKNCTICHRQTQQLMQILKLHNLPQINPKLNANFKNCAICHRQTQELMQILKLHNLPQINTKLNANFKNCTICHRQTQNLMQFSKLHNLPQTNPKTYANFKTPQSSTDKPKT